jgi:probable rRNA maturation factor
VSRVPVHIDVDTASGGWPEVLAGAGEVARRAAAAALGAARLPAGLAGRGLELSLVLTDDATIRRLNRGYRGLDRPTNVLSFGLLEAAGPVAGADVPVPLGDVVVARETATAEAAAAGKPLDHHLSHLVVHGVLHLLGYDHETEPDAEQMAGAEVAALAALGVPDPDHAEPAGTPTVAARPPLRVAGR